MKQNVRRKLVLLNHSDKSQVSAIEHLVRRHLRCKVRRQFPTPASAQRQDREANKYPHASLDTAHLTPVPGGARFIVPAGTSVPARGAQTKVPPAR